MQITQSFTIPFRLPSLNDYIDACRRNKFEGAKMKRYTEDAISLYLLTLKPFKNPVGISFIWFEEKRNRDPDNIAFAKKFILDALVRRGILANDTGKYVHEFKDEFIYGKKDGVYVQFWEVGGDENG